MSPKLKLCLHCVEADQQQFGVSYYHRVHQLFGVLVCPLHAVSLVETAVPTSNQQTRYAFISAEQAQQDVLQPVAIGSESWLPLLLQIARDAAWLLQSSAPPSGLKELQRRYLVHLARHDLATSSGQIRVGALLDAFQSRYPADLLQMLHCAIDAESEDPWLLRLVRSPKGAQHPLRHLLLIHLLEQTAESFLTEEPAEERRPFGTGPWICLNPVCESHGTPIITACAWVDNRYTDGRPVGTFTCPRCGFSYAHTQTDLPPKCRPPLRRLPQMLIPFTAGHHMIQDLEAHISDGSLRRPHHNGPLLHRHALCQVARLVHITPPLHCKGISQQLRMIALLEQLSSWERAPERLLFISLGSILRERLEMART